MFPCFPLMNGVEDKELDKKVLLIEPKKSNPLMLLQVTKRLGSEIPIVTSVTEGIIGCDALTDEFKEVNLKHLFIVE